MTFLTNLKLEPKGIHSAAQAYNVSDVVTSADGSVAYVAIKDVPIGISLTNTGYWVKILDLADVREAAATAAAAANAAADAGVRTDVAQNLGAGQKNIAQENIGLKEIVRSLTDGFEVFGNPVVCNPVGGLAFDGIETHFSPKQSGNGDPSPENIRPIGGYDKLTLNQAGKNLIDKDTIQPINDPWDKPTPITTGIRITADLSVYKEPTYRTSPLKIGAIEDYMGKTVTIQAKTKASASNVPAMVLSVRTANNTSVESLTGVLTGSNIKQTVQIPDSEAYAGAYLCLVLYSNLNGTCADGDYAEYTDLMLEFGSEATEYEPFKGHNTYTVQIGQTVYGGRMNWLTGELVSEWTGHVFDGTESLNSYENEIGFYISDAGLYAPDNISAYQCVCSHYKGLRRNDTYVNATTEGYMGVSANKNYVRFVDNVSYPGGNMEGFKAMLAAQSAAGTPVQVAWLLATPQIIQLTPQQIAALQGVNTLYGDGTINVAGRQPQNIALEKRIAALEAAALNA